MKPISTGVGTCITYVALELPEYNDLSSEEFEEVNVDEILDILIERREDVQVSRSDQSDDSVCISLLVPYKSINPER